VPHSRGFRPRISGATRRQTAWLGFSPALSTLTTAGGTIVYSLNAAALAARPFTVVRTHMELYIISDQAAASEDQIGAFGWCVVSDQALAIGVTAVPTPITDLGSDLFFVHKIAMSSLLKDSTAGFAAVAGTPYTVDSKAMRKVNDDQDIVGVAEVAVAGNGIILFSAGRMLVKLH